MWLLSPVSALLLAVIVHAVAARVSGSFPQVMRFLLASLTVGLILAGLLFEAYGFSPEAMSGLLVYAFGCELYIFLFTMALSSISANLLVRLSQQPRTSAEIVRNYGGDEMARRRLARLVDTGILKQTPHGLELTNQGMRLLRVFDCLAAIFRFPKENEVLTRSGHE